MSLVADNVAKLRDRIAASIQLVAVTKRTPVEAIREAIEAGITAIGENRIQEALTKFPEIGRDVQWHLVGHLQSNKAGPAAELFDLIHSVDSLRIAQALSRSASQSGRDLDILIQVNTSGEETKFGVSPQEALPLLEKIHDLPGIHVKGLMTIGPFRPNPEEARPSFHSLRRLSEKIRSLNIDGVEMTRLSMGMSGDFEVAIEEGANLVRIGTSVFGPRE